MTDENRYSDQLAAPGAPPALAVRRSLPPAREPATVYLAGLRSSGRRAQAAALARLAAFLGSDDPRTLPWEALAYGHAQRVSAWLRDESGLAPATARRYWAALRGVLRTADALGLMPAGEWGRIQGIRPRFGKSAEAGRALSDGEISALLNLGGPRAAIVALGALAGLRREEIVGLDVGDLVTEGPQAPAVRVRGKGGKERVVPLGARASSAVFGWAMRHKVKLDDDRPLFPGRASFDRRLSLSGVANVLERAAASAGVPRFTPHDLRRTYVTTLLARGNDLAVVAKLAGHEQIETTKRYDRRGDDAKRKAVETLD